MKIEELKGCFDSITPTQEQRDKILAGIMKAKETPVKVVKLNRYKYLSVAAVVAIGVFVAVYSGVGKNVVPQVDTHQNTEENNVSTYAVNDEQKADTTEVLPDNTVVPETDNVQPIEKTPSDTGEESLADNLHEAYPELEDENAQNSPSLAMFDNEENARIMPAPEAAEPSETEQEIPEVDAETYLDEKYSIGGGGGGGSSSGGGGYAPTEYYSLTITEVMNHQVYSAFMPVVYADKYNFYTATEYTNRLKVVFRNEIGNYMSLSVFKDGEYTFYEQVLTPEEIKDITPEGHMNFAVKCGDYYVVYNIDTYDSSAVYDMVISSAYFNN